MRPSFQPLPPFPIHRAAWLGWQFPASFDCAGHGILQCQVHVEMFPNHAAVIDLPAQRPLVHSKPQMCDNHQPLHEGRCPHVPQFLRQQSARSARHAPRGQGFVHQVRRGQGQQRIQYVPWSGYTRHVHPNYRSVLPWQRPHP